MASSTGASAMMSKGEAASLAPVKSPCVAKAKTRVAPRAWSEVGPSYRMAI